ncbi:MAG: sigma-54 dependent transcriptional regulator [Saprospiraceae bacterium]|nr:sigma-54 dependent transcriptional regulator [Saprospiraceae bacterium]
MTLQGIKQRFGIIGRSPLLDRALDTAIRVANTDLTVLIFGESGVGKEVFSKIIHSLSKRKHNTFIAINCGAIPAGTINSELFGHEKGAFTGATSDRKGYFETVNGGTIFLDEVGEMPLDTQSFLLRILESGEFIRVGSSKVRKTDVRVIAATNVDLRERIKAGKFREDLYYRLNTVPIRIPSLKERKEDIWMLFRKFASDFEEKYRSEHLVLDEEAKELILNYHWPGNIRELKNVAEQLSVLSTGKVITAKDIINLVPDISQRYLPSIPEQLESAEGMKERDILYTVLFDMKKDLNDLKSLVFELIQSNDLEMPDKSSWVGESRPQLLEEWKAKGQPSSKTQDESAPFVISRDDAGMEHDEDVIVMEDNLSLEEMEKKMITRALEKHNGRRKEAAEELGISERTLYRKINQYGI